MQRPKHPTQLFLVLAGLCLVLTLHPTAASSGYAVAGTVQATENDQQVRIVGVRVTPAANDAAKSVFSPDTLCKLTVLIENHSTRPVFSLAFQVEVGGESLLVYEKQLFMVPVHPTAQDSESAPAASKPFELELFNFWTSDSRRQAPANGKLAVTVKLIEAQWLDIGEEKSGEESVEVWTPKGAVPGLPSAQTITIQLQKPKN